MSSNQANFGARPAKVNNLWRKRQRFVSFCFVFVWQRVFLTARESLVYMGRVCAQRYQIGFFRSTLYLGPVHPWQFVEEASSKEVERDFNSVYSRLVLCKTFRLNEDGKVLTPEELLYRCVEAVNFTHNPQHAQMDVKLRSLICLGLNEQVIQFQ